LPYRLMITIALGLLVILPLFGVVINGGNPSIYIQFPPITQDVPAMPFSWLAFVFLALMTLLTVTPFIYRVWLTNLRCARNGVTIDSPNQAHPFPWWGWAGLSLTALAWWVAWTRLPLFASIQMFTFTPLWLGYILVVNALTYRRTGTCMLLDRPVYLLRLFGVSAAFWWFFEYLNRFVQNWYYVGADVLSPLQYVVFATLPFATVLPAVMGTSELLQAYPRLTAGLSAMRPLSLKRPNRVAGLALLLAASGLALIGVFPSQLFPLLWVSPLIILTAIQQLGGRATILAPLARGDWSRLARLALAALICGVFWELWNDHSLAKWIYQVPYVGRFKIFEMPILGFAGYLPFGLECAVIAEFCRSGADRKNASEQWKQLRQQLMSSVLSTALFVAGVSVLPYAWCSRHAAGWVDRDPERQLALANGVNHWLVDGLGRDDFQTGSDQFNGEWLFGTYLMAGIGYGQLALQQPHQRVVCLARMEQCIDALLSDDVRAFDREMWGNDPVATLDSSDDHAAYLGYFNLLLGLNRAVDPDSRFGDLHDRITAALSRRLQNSRIGLLQSYPGEIYPVDNCAVLGSIALHTRITGSDRTAQLSQWLSIFQQRYIDPQTGLIIQAIEPGSGDAIDWPRGSGTTLGLYFLSFADTELSRSLYAATRQHLFRRVFGFGGVREYAAGHTDGRGDIDSGPIIFGFGLSPTGFLIAGSLIHGDDETFARLYATAHVWGAPIERQDRLNFVTGASLGDAIMFAMLTALPSQDFETAVGVATQRERS
ncbi:MAG: hypothetical protein O3A51_13395, partial [Verrucomicrobia bacterium]|nr:hypothetical protein [Verrucomicrobiota bacterium]